MSAVQPASAITLPHATTVQPASAATLPAASPAPTPKAVEKEAISKKESALPKQEAADEKKPIPPPTKRELNQLCVVPILGSCIGLTLLIYSLGKMALAAIGMLYCRWNGRECTDEMETIHKFKRLAGIGFLWFTWVGAIWLVLYDKYHPLDNHPALEYHLPLEYHPPLKNYPQLEYHPPLEKKKENSV